MKIIMDRIEANCEHCEEEFPECIRIQLAANHIHLCDDCAEAVLIMLREETESLLVK